ncbi:uncharacterized protein kairos [Halyomorpha halys]|uniref:uncharacterized protein kairos n=1 Tax=Halyomorpha halys TaxID=286706 RepID=UPI0006D4CC47|nr:uncharacterized protein LOC106688182 [Halyomorpha halys]
MSDTEDNDIPAFPFTLEMLRRSSLAGPSGEPLIVVEESGGIQEEEEEEEMGKEQESAPDSPLLNPYLLSPYRDMRKRSLPTPQCTSGITASQVRRLSEQGGEGGKGPSPMEAAFLATLSQAPAPSPGGRRHSVVTISRAPPTSILFGRDRRESIAAFGSRLPPRFPRKDSTPSLSGSSFNLQLDIMDDIAEIKAARKVKLKMWQTENEEKVCEVREGASVARYHQKESRRFSDVTGIAPLKDQAVSRRRASEAPPPGTSQPTTQSGIVCSNNDLITLMSSLTSSAQEITEPPQQPPQQPPIEPPKPPSVIDEKRNLLKNNRSNSFDVSLLPDCTTVDVIQKGGPSNWFLRRHMPMANKKGNDKSDTQTPADKPLERKSGSLKTTAEKEKEKRKDKVVWDKPSGSVVDPQVIGSAIEVFLNKRTSETPAPSAAQSTESLKKNQKSSWFSNEPKESDEEVSCDNSICSTLKDLFVK